MTAGSAVRVGTDDSGEHHQHAGETAGPDAPVTSQRAI